MKILKPLLPIMLFLLVLVPVCRAEQEIVVVQSARIAPYEEARQGFMQVIAAAPPLTGTKRVSFAHVTTLVLSEEVSPSLVRRKIAGQKPDLLVAIGSQALGLAREFADLPVVHMMIPCRPGVHQPGPGISGVCMAVSPDRQLRKIVAAMPGIKRLGLVFDPARSADLVDAARAAARNLGVTLLVREVASAKQVPAAVDSLVSRVDALWMLPDQTVITPQAVEYLLHVSLEQRKPVITFSEKYLRMGAVAAIVFDLNGMGRQAGELARKVLASPKMSWPEENAEKIQLKVNRKMAAKLAVEIHSDGVVE